MALTITSAYAGLATLLFVVLSFRVIGTRRSARIGLGDGGNTLLLRRVRAHGNFAEYVPLCLLLMAMAELQNSAAVTINIIGLLLIAGRLLHAFGVSRAPGKTPFRTIGMVMTFAALITAAAVNLVHSASAVF